jgi:CII-binding regulator of phage lambda lysogenization HflD
MASPRSRQEPEGGDEKELLEGESGDPNVSLQSSLDEVKESLERLARSVAELNSKLRSTGDVLKWVLEALSRRSEEKEVMYLRSIEASNELLSNFMAFVNSRVKPLAEEVTTESKEKILKKEALARETTAVPVKKGEEYLVKPSMVRKLQEEEGKEKDKRGR